MSVVLLNTVNTLLKDALIFLTGSVILFNFIVSNAHENPVEKDQLSGVFNSLVER